MSGIKRVKKRSSKFLEDEIMSMVEQLETRRQLLFGVLTNHSQPHGLGMSLFQRWRSRSKTETVTVGQLIAHSFNWCYLIVYKSSCKSHQKATFCWGPWQRIYTSKVPFGIEDQHAMFKCNNKIKPSFSDELNRWCETTLSRKVKMPRRVESGFEGRVTHTTVTQVTGAHIPPATKHHESFPHPIQADGVPNLNQM